MKVDLSMFQRGNGKVWMSYVYIYVLAFYLVQCVTDGADWPGKIIIKKHISYCDAFVKLLGYDDIQVIFVFNSYTCLYYL